MLIPLLSQVILITGASRGLGLETAHLLSKSGYTVYAGTRKTPTTDASFHQIYLDVTDQTSIDCAIETIMAKEGKIDALINNAATLVIGSTEALTLAESQKVFDVNFFGPMRMMQAILPIMQSPEEIAQLIQEVLEAKAPHFRYQTSPTVKAHAAKRLVDPTGDANLAEWDEVFSPHK